jgi:D-alanyl-D-alanine carboxypeptidase/D-alanyl-D-alanine-endopeptidase (penicillin-binding protein 4)
MKRFVFLLALWLIGFCFDMCANAGLKQDVDAILQDKSLVKDAFGVEIVQLGTGEKDSRSIYSANSDQLLIPASNLKLITTSAALDRLGSDFKFKTQLVFHDGNLILIGGGDPAFGDAELLTRVGWDVTTVFQNWARQVKSLNLGSIKSVIVDDSIFDEQVVHPNWPADQRLDWYEAEVAGMNLNQNCLDVYLRPRGIGEPVTCSTDPGTRFVKIENSCVTDAPGSDAKPWLNHPEGSNEMTLRGKASVANDVPIQITIHDGPMFAATVLAETLAATGTASAGDVRHDRTMNQQMQKAIAGGDKRWQLIAVHETPLAQVLQRANRESKNLYAECLCKRLGAEVSNEPGSWKNGGEANAAFLKKVGVPSNQFQLDDGSGLSKENLITASAIARVLCHDYFSTDAAMFKDSLAVAGGDGTLKNRFAGTSLRGRVLAKTGTVRGVSALSGYLNARNGKCYVFSILINKDTSGTAKPIEEKIVQVIDGLK